MPLDPYFTSTGARTHTCMGQPRQIPTASERQELAALLALPDGARGKLNLDIRERKKAHLPLTRVELFFHHKMRYLGRFNPARLVHHPEK
jgi:hypothetical protein